MSARQLELANMMIGETVTHSNGRSGVVIGVIIAKKGKGVWYQISDNAGTWCMYRRCK